MNECRKAQLTVFGAILVLIIVMSLLSSCGTARAGCGGNPMHLGN